MITTVNPNQEKPLVLIVEDEPALADIYSTIIRHEGLAVATADDGVAGLEAALKLRPALVMLDLILPIKDGFEVLRDLKSDPRTKDIPVVILTNLGQDYEVKRGLALGAELFLIKAAVNPADVAARVRKILEVKGLIKA